MKWALAGIAALVVLSSPAASRAEEPAARLAGRWKVKFDNGVVELCVLGKDQTASVWEPRRQAAGKIEVRDGRVLVVYDDDRLERWAPVGRRAVVEHWARAADYPGKPPVLGIAEADYADQEGANRREPTEGVQFRREENAIIVAKTFVDAMRRERAGEAVGLLRECIDPRYLKEHNLQDGAFPIRRVVTGAILTKSLVDPQTVFMLVETDEAEKEVWLLRVAEVDGKMYVVPPRPPDRKTKAFTAWSFRWKL